MNSPTLIFAALLATFYGAFFHLWKGGGLGRLLLDLIMGWLGFWAGQSLAGYFAWSIDTLGALHIGAATVGSLAFLLVGNWLTRIEVEVS